MSGAARIITFYSYKGGTGRSMHLANVAWILASNGKRVLAVDWDLEAPGLHRYFRPFLIDKELSATDGLIDLMWDFADAAMTPVPDADRRPGWHEDYADLLRCTAAVRWRWPNSGRLDLLPAGRQSPSYSRRVNSFNWQNFYDRLGGGVFLESVKERMRREYDYVLIDSRTGVSDTAGICTVQMPDVLVMCFTANNQSIEGCASIARSVREQWAGDAQRSLDRRQILPLLTRVDGSEKDKLNARRALARARFDPYVASLSSIGSIDDYWRDTEVSYVPWYSYEEVVAAFADKYKEKISILDAAEALTRVITHGEITSLVRPSDEERVRVLVEFASGGDAIPDAAPIQTSQPLIMSPYPGLRSFTTIDAPMFFGRDAEIDNLVARLRAGERELYMMGPSGSGKTSLVCAGLIPLLENSPERVETRFLIRLLRPGIMPFAALSAVFEGKTPFDPNRVQRAVAALLAHHAECDRVLIVIDQLEELFTIADGVERARCIDGIHALRTDPRVVLLLVLRADYYGTLLESRLSEGLDARSERIQVDPLHGDPLREAITGPARAIGVRIEPALIERLVADLNDQPGALPLLQVILNRLWAYCRGALTAAHYTELGGLQAIADHAAAVFRKLARVEEATALAILLRLVSFGEGRSDTRRQQPRSALRSAGASVVAFDSTLKHLVDNRLVTATSGEHGEILIDLAHEALIDVWPTLADWVETWRDHELQRRDLESSASAWRAHGSGLWGLLAGESLAGAVAWRAAARQLGQSTDLTALLAASEAARIRSRQRHRGLSQLLLAGIALFVVFGVLLYRETAARTTRVVERDSDIEHRSAQPADAQLYQENGRQLLLDDKRPLRALPYLMEAWATKVDAPGMPLRILLAQAARHLPIAEFKHDGIVSSATVDPSGSIVVTTGRDHTARVWDLARGKPLSAPLVHQGNVPMATFSRDGVRIITTGAAARIWNMHTFAPMTLQLGEGDIVRTAAFSPDGFKIVTASDDWTARIWNALDGHALHAPLKHHGVVRSAAFSPDGNRIVTASEDLTARIWDATTGNPLSQPLRHRGIVTSAAFSPDGNRVVTASTDRTACVWDAVTGTPASSALAHGGAVNSAAFSADGTRVVTASSDWTARVWDAATGNPIVSLAHGSAVNSAAFSPDGKLVVTTSDDLTARVWDAGTGKPVTTPLEHQARVSSAMFTPDGARVVTVSDESIARVWDVSLGDPIVPLRHQLSVSSASFSTDGALIVTSSADHTARVWDARSGMPAAQPLQHEDHVIHAAFSLDDAHVITASRDGSARIWSTRTGALVAPPLKHEDSVVSAAFSHDGAHVVTASPDRTARIWSVSTGKLMKRLGHARAVNHAAFSPQGTYVVTASDDHAARVWVVSTGELLSRALEHDDGVVNAAFSPDGAYVVTASRDRTARIWDITTEKASPVRLAHKGPVTGAEFSPDGTRVVTASEDGTARVWDARTGQPLSPPLVHQGSVLSAAFSPDGLCVVTASADRTVMIWDAASGKPLAPPLLHKESVVSAMFSSDGRRIVTASDDGTSLVWELPLASGTFATWATRVEHASPYVLKGGVLSARFSKLAMSGDDGTSEHP